MCVKKKIVSSEQYRKDAKDAISHPGDGARERAGDQRRCDAERLSIRGRIKIFLKASDALAYAHRRLIVHRDIKPGAVLVTRDGVPKLPDFGIARPLASLAESEDLIPTTVNGRLMTPRCAIFRRIKGKTISAAADVHRAGVLLYELLAGRGPRAKSVTIKFIGLSVELLSAIISNDVSPRAGSWAKSRGPGKTGATPARTLSIKNSK